MRKRLYTRNVGILLTENSYQQLIDITDKLEITISGYLRDLVEKELKENQKEELQNE
jgi:ABC-type lipopolysaccharide export system ATPase subunit